MREMDRFVQLIWMLVIAAIFIVFINTWPESPDTRPSDRTRGSRAANHSGATDPELATPVALLESARQLLASEQESERQRAIEPLEKLARDWGAVGYRQTTFGELAHAYRNRHPWQQLGAGRMAPEIVGRTVAGEEVRLSDFRGKVVLLSFWGHW